MNNMSMERGCSQPVFRPVSSGKTMAKIDSKTTAAASTSRRGNEDPYDSDSYPAYRFPYFVQDQLETRLDNACAASSVEHCDPLWSPGTIPFFPKIFGPQPTFEWAGGEDILLSATVSSDGACNNVFVIHYEGTTDAAQQAPPSPGMDRDPSATLESSTVLLSQELVDDDTCIPSRLCSAGRASLTRIPYS